jgi:hypothetical protein
MDTDRLQTGTTIAATAAIALLGVMFLGWFSLTGISAEGSFGTGVPSGDAAFGEQQLEAAANAFGADTSVNAWEAFDVIDIVLALAAVAAIALAVTQMRGPDGQSVSAFGMVVTALGLVAAGLIAYRIVSPPDLLGFFGGGDTAAVRVDTEVGREPWLFVGFAAAAGMAAGGFLAVRDARG